MIPDAPKISEDDLRRCRESGDYCPVFFEWYKFVGGLSMTFAFLQLESPVLRQIPRRDYAVLTGLINRCGRLMLSNMALSHDGKFGEATAVLDRCIYESSVTVSWLCGSEGAERFERYIVNSLKPEGELREQIEANIAARNGETLVIERRMLESMGRLLSETGLDQAAIDSTKKLPDLASMIASIGRPRLEYTVGQRIGSHHVHGTWVSLNIHYLQRDEHGVLMARGEPSSAHVNQYFYIPMVVLDALASFVGYVFQEVEEKAVILKLFEDTRTEMLELYKEAIGNDFSVV